MKILNRFVQISILLMLVTPMIVIAATDNDSIIPSAKKGAAVLPQSAKDGISNIVNLAMYVVATIAVLAAIFAAGLAIFSKDRAKKNEGITWLGYIIVTSLSLGIVFAVINGFLFT